jgi:hypothetical protein
MFVVHKPEYWIFGHHHKKVEKEIDGTIFIGLDELKYGNIDDCFYEIPGLAWEG